MPEENDIDLNEKDPLYPSEPVDDGSFKEPELDLASNIANRLSEEEAVSEEHDVIEPETPIPFDINKLSKEQLQSLKALLNATPDQVAKKKGNPKVFIRSIEGNLVMDFKRAYKGLILDEENNRKVERHLIPVKFFGGTEFKDVLYSVFINSERVPCEVLSIRTKQDTTIEGETISRETGTVVEVVRNDVKHWFTIKLPDGKQVEIEDRLANA